MHSSASSDSSADSSAEPSAPYAPPVPPVDMYGIAPDSLYTIIRELRRQADDATTHGKIRAMLQAEPAVLLAVSRVLHESGLLRRAVVAESGAVEEQILPLPEAPSPQALAAPRSWA